MRVLIADGQDVVRRGLAELLMDAFPETVISEARNKDEISSQVAEGQFDLLILDINIPGDNGLKVLRDAIRNHPETPVIIVSMHSEEQYAKPCLRAGAAAYIKKDCASDDLALAVETIVGSRMGWSASDSM